MNSVEKIKYDLIDKILSIRDKDFLQALDKLISSNPVHTDIVELNENQKTMLEMSNQDINSGNLIAQEEMIKRNLKWLREA